MSPRVPIHRAAVALAAALALLPVGARAQSAPRLGAGRVAAQIATGTVGGVVGFVGLGLLTRSVARHRGADDEDASHPAFVGALVGAALLTPVGPALVGNHDGAGSYAAAQGGAVAGGLASALLVGFGRSGAIDCRLCAPLRILTGFAVAMLPSVGATIAYDATRRR